MTGYLQRLFDRGGGDAPMPAAASMSPVAQADQRLTVPGIGDTLMWQAPAFGLDAEPTGEGPVPTGLTPPSPTRRMIETPSTRPEMPIRSLMAPPPAPMAPPPRTAEAPDPPALQPRRPPAVPTPIRQVGAIEASDLELPADADATALPTVPHAPPVTEPEPVTPAPAAPAIVDRVRPAAKPVLPPHPAAPALAPATPVERNIPASEPAAAQPAPAPEPAPPRLAEPAPRAPMLAMPAPVAEPPPLEIAPPVQTAPRPPAPKPEPRRVETIRAPEPARAPRPLTANEVSVIGPLPASRRAATMFGVRRR